MEYLLSLVIFFPAFAGIFVFIIGNEPAKPYGIIVSLLELVLVLILWIFFDSNNFDMQFVNHFEIVKSIGINYSVGVDGISLFLIALNAFIIFLATIYLNQTFDKNHYVVCLLLLESILMGLFSSLNVIMFYAFWELSLLPILYIVGVWGTGDRIYAALKFFLYTFAASLLMLVGILYMGYLSFTQLGFWSFDLFDWYKLSIPMHLQIWLFLAFFISIAVKIPIIPFHTWLPYIYSDAPAIGSLMLSAVLLKMGTYALVRFSIALFPDASFVLSFYIAILALFMIVYGGIIAFKQRDIKQVIAYSSISHMGVAILGIFSFNIEGISGSIFLMVGHGVVSGALFLLLGMLYHRIKTRDIDSFGGLASVAPHYSAFFAIVMFANVGLPLTIGFVGEFLSLLGFFKTSAIITAIAGTTLIISAVYMLYLFRNIFFGSIKDINKKMKDLNFREYAVLIPVVIVVVWLGIFPNTILTPMQESTKNLVQLMSNRAILSETIDHIDKVYISSNNCSVECKNKLAKKD